MDATTFQEWTHGDEDVTLTLVFTDIVASTRIGQQLGDRVWIDELGRHFDHGRTVAGKYGGYVVKVIGDAFMVAFRTPTDAVEFAMEFSLNTGVDHIGIRIGIHSGQVRIVGNDVYGLNVNKASRIQSSLTSQGIAMSTAVKDDFQKVRGRDSGVRFLLHAAKPKNFTSTRVWVLTTGALRQMGKLQSKARNELIGVDAEQPSVMQPLAAPPLEPKAVNPKLARMFALNPRYPKK